MDNTQLTNDQKSDNDNLKQIEENNSLIPEDIDKNYDMFYHHLRLEILESRINYGFDEEHSHPGIATLIEYAIGQFDLTQEE